MLTIIDSDAVINKNASKIWKYFILQITFFSLKFAGIVLFEIAFVLTVFVGAAFAGILLVTSTISSHVITESPVILSKYLPFSEVHVLGF